MGLLGDISRSVGDTVLENVGRAVGRAQERTPLPVDLLESDDAYLAVFDAPGADRRDVQVQYRDGAIEVRIDRFRGFHEGFEMRYPGRGLALDGALELPEDARVDPTAATATLQPNGTLEVRVPRVHEEHDGEDGDDADESDEADSDEWESVSVDDGEDDDESDESAGDSDGA